MTFNRDFLKQFCAIDEANYRQINEPSMDDRYIYATNGHIAIRIYRYDGANFESPIKSLPGLWEEMEGTHNADNAIPIPEVTTNDCKVCHKAGKIKNDKCRDCDGHGSFEHGDHEYECQECDGSGNIDGREYSRCYECNGSGKECVPILIGNSSYASAYLELIKKCPNVIFINGRDKHSPAKFIFDGGEGFVMPMADGVNI